MALVTLAAIQFGGYVSPWKVLPVLLLLLAWARLLTWIDKDSTPSHLPRAGINSVMLGVLVLGYLLFFLLPGFPVAFSVLLVLFLGDMGLYLGLRARKVGLKDLTVQLQSWYGRLLKKSEPEEQEAVSQRVVLGRRRGLGPIGWGVGDEPARELGELALRARVEQPVVDRHERPFGLG